MLIKSKMAKRVAEKKGRFPFSLFILGKGKAIEIKLADPNAATRKTDVIMKNLTPFFPAR